MDQQEPTDLLLTPAACYPLYPVIAARGMLPSEGGLYDMHSWCFRREPSRDPTRMQTFRVREFVRMGKDEQVLEFRQAWLDRAQDFVNDLSLPYVIDVAHDPFFGARRSSAGRQPARAETEIRIAGYSINGESKPTACVSFNYHLTHFSEAWDIRLHDGSQAYSGCVGFGLDRIALALFKHHGVNFSTWPATVLQTLRVEP